MKCPRTMRTAIRKAVLERLGQGRWTLEVGLRDDLKTGNWVPNVFNWEPDADLGDLVKLVDLKEIDDHESGGWELDVYCYAIIGSGQYLDMELDCNVAVFGRGKEIIGAVDETWDPSVSELREKARGEVSA